MDFWKQRAEKMKTGLHPWQAVSLTGSVEEAVARQQRDSYAVRRAIKSLMSRPTSILDLGCGVGRLTVDLAFHYDEARICGVDRELGFIQEATKQLDEIRFVRFVERDALDVVPENWDVVVIAGLLCCLDDFQFNVLVNNLRCCPRIVIKDSVGTKKRYAFKDRWSDALQTEYTATYRTVEEITDAFLDHEVILSREVEKRSEETSIHVLALQRQPTLGEAE